MGQGPPVEIYEDGEESRDFVYIDDVVSATVRCTEYSKNFIGALNVGSGVATSVLNVAKEIRSFFKSNSEIKISGAYRFGDIRHNVADVSRAREVMALVPGVPFEQGLHNFLTWASAQPQEEGSSYAKSVSELNQEG